MFCGYTGNFQAYFAKFRRLLTPDMVVSLPIRAFRDAGRYAKMP